MFFDLHYLVFMLPAFVLSLIATAVTHSTFERYSRVRSRSGFTGAEAAHRLLAAQGIHNVTIERVDGFLSDHYDPTSRTLRLSGRVFDSSSLSAIGVACHEAGHAMQHAQAYTWLGLRSALVPATQIGSSASYIFILLGMMMNFRLLLMAGIVLFTVVVLFSLITLPVEWDASARAKRLMVAAGVVGAAEREDAGKVLNAAFLTYVAGAVTALMTLLYYLARAGLLGGRRND